IRSVAQHEGLSQACLERMDKAERVVPKMQATIEFVSGYVRQQVRQLDLTPPVSYAMHAHLIPSCYLERVAQMRTVHAGEPLRELAKRLRTPLYEPGGALAALSEVEQSALHQQAQELAEVFQRSSSNVEGRNGYLSLRNHQLRGLDRPRKRECLTAIHNFFLTRADGSTAAERFFGQKPRSMFAAILQSVDLPHAPVSQSPASRRVEWREQSGRSRDQGLPLHPMEGEGETFTNRVSPGTVCCGTALGAGGPCDMGRLGVCYASCLSCRPSPPLMRYDRAPRRPHVDHVLACGGVRVGGGTGGRPRCGAAAAHHLC